MAKCVMNLAALRQTIGAQPLHFAVRLGLLKESFAMQYALQWFAAFNSANAHSFCHEHRIFFGSTAGMYSLDRVQS